MGYPQPNSGVRSIDGSRGPTRCQIDAILRLQAAVWNDNARVGHIRTIRLDLTLSIRAILSGRGLDNSSPERSEQKRDHQRGPVGIDGRQVTALRWVQNWASRQGAQRRGRLSSEVALAHEDHCFAGVAARTTGGHADGGPSALSGVGIGIGWPSQPPSVLGSADECGDRGTARRVANSVKTSPKAGTLWRSLLKSALGMIKISMAVRARSVAFRVLSESNAISPKYSPRPRVARISRSPFCSRKTSHSPLSMTYTLSPRSPCWKMKSPGSKY